MEALGSADWILGTYECPSKSRVHAALCFGLGQPFYGWFRMANPVLQPVSTGLVDRLQPLLALTVLVSFLSRDVAFDCGRS